MKIDIWSDIVCPFCYIGKKTFEKALQNFEYKNEVEIIWHSYQLSPQSTSNTNKTSYEIIAEREGIDVEDVILIYKYIEEMAENVGLNYSLEKLYPANTRKAHRLLQIAKQYNKGIEAEELLFKAYFSEFLNIEKQQTLDNLANKLEIDHFIYKNLRDTEETDQKVSSDIKLAKKLNISEVPYFLFNKNISIKGVQSESVFLNTLKKAWQDKQVPQIETSEIIGKACSIDGKCQ